MAVTVKRSTSAQGAEYVDLKCVVTSAAAQVAWYPGEPAPLIYWSIDIRCAAAEVPIIAAFVSEVQRQVALLPAPKES